MKKFTLLTLVIINICFSIGLITNKKEIKALRRLCNSANKLSRELAKVARLEGERDGMKFILNDINKSEFDLSRSNCFLSIDQQTEVYFK